MGIFLVVIVILRGVIEDYCKKLRIISQWLRFEIRM